MCALKLRMHLIVQIKCSKSQRVYAGVICDLIFQLLPIHMIHNIYIYAAHIYIYHIIYNAICILGFIYIYLSFLVCLQVKVSFLIAFCMAQALLG